MYQNLDLHDRFTRSAETIRFYGGEGEPRGVYFSVI